METRARHQLRPQAGHRGDEVARGALDATATRRRRGRWRTRLGVLALYFVVFEFSHLSDRLLLFPTTAPIPAGGATRQTLAWDGGELEFWTATSRLAQGWAGKRPDAVVLRFYGNADRPERWVAAETEEWSKDGSAVEVWGMNYPGFGGSTGPARVTKIGPAALAAFDMLKTTAGPDRPIVVFGTSLGSGAALHVAAHRPVAGLVLHNPPALRQIVLWQHGWWNLRLLAGPVAWQLPTDLDSVVNARHVRAPAVFLLAEQDEIVLPKFQRLVVDAYAGEKRVITLRGARHNSPIEGAAVAELRGALDWLLSRN